MTTFRPSIQLSMRAPVEPILVAIACRFEASVGATEWRTPNPLNASVVHTNVTSLSNEYRLRAVSLCATTPGCG